MSTLAVWFFILASSFLAEEKVVISQKEITLLIEKMADEKFAVREKAHKRLVEIAQKDEHNKFLPLLKKALVHRDPEVAFRVKMIIKEYYFVQPTAYPYMPALEMLPWEMPSRREIIDKYVALVPLREREIMPRYWALLPKVKEIDRPLTQEEIEKRPDAGLPYFYYHTLRVATILYITDLLKNGMTRFQARQLLDKMVEQEKEWEKR